MEIVFEILFISLVALQAAYAASIDSKETHTVNITRHQKGDILIMKDVLDCNQYTCLKMTNGSAFTIKDPKHSIETECKCRCDRRLKTYREDLSTCVDTIKECSLIPFVSSITALDTVERIPSVFLPLQGQIIYPNKELLFPNDHKCVIVSANYMTQHGWSDVKNSFNSNDIPFRLFLDKNRTFLQWSGDSSYRALLQGRLVILRLACWNGSTSFQNGGEETVKNLSPCISFRVTGNLLKFTSNMSEIQFALESNIDSGKEQFSTNEYLIIAISSFCLGLMYIASVALYIYLKRRKNNGNSSSSSNSNDSDKNFTRGDADMHHSSFRQSSLLSPPLDFMEGNQPNVIKSNPLVGHFMSFNENNAFVSDSSVDEDEQQRDEIDLDRQSPTNLENECLPMSITEDSEGKNDMSRSFQNGPPRRKLYFNPAYFEPELLASPPPAAVEFLTKIREVISMAKNKMSAKRFHPVLNYISEEDSQKADSVSHSNNNTLHSKKSALSSQINTNKESCAGCPGCKSKSNMSKHQNSKRCTNCGDKNNIIQKWLENVSSSSNETSSDSFACVEKVNDKRPLIGDGKASKIDSIRERIASPTPSSSTKSIKEEISIVKGFVKEKNIFVQRDRKHVDDSIFDNGSIPKIVSHSLKKNIKEMIYSQNFVRDKVNVFEGKKDDKDSTNGDKEEKLEAAHEIYNNPKFCMDQEADTTAKAYSAVVKRKQEVLDQYSNPMKGTASKPNLNRMPDMIYEAIEMEKKNKFTDESPTPDYYSSEYEMTKFRKYDNVSFAPFVPTPDYYTYGRNYVRNLKHYQPDSPIYSRKSPAYLVVDYETDSLERLNTLKKRNSATPTRSDISSSQPSPSSALPLEEEVEIRNALYDKEEGFRKDTDTIRKEREIDIQMRKTKIKYNTPNEGSMTIELEAISPDDNDEATSSTDSDDFEPDTLDRHAKMDKVVLYKAAAAKRREKKIIEEFDTYDDKGFLMLNFRQSKRQRNSGEASLKKLPNSSHNNNSSNKPTSKAQTSNKSIPPDVISSSFKKSFQEAPLHCKKTMDEHSFKKSLVSAPIQFTSDIEMERKFIKMDFPNDYQNNRHSIMKTINHVKIPDASPKFSDAFNENMRKTWKRFVGMAFKRQECEDEEGGSKNIKAVAAEIEQGKVKSLIRKLNIVHVHDSGYLSSESMNNNENMLKNSEVKLEENGKKVKNFKTRPMVPPPPIPKTSLETSFINNKNYEDLINISIYSSDDQNSSIHESENEDERRIGEEVEDVGADSDFSFVQ